MSPSSTIWIVALVLAAGAPWLVRALADRLELPARRRTEALITRARARMQIAPQSDLDPEERSAGAG